MSRERKQAKAELGDSMDWEKKLDALKAEIAKVETAKREALSAEKKRTEELQARAAHARATRGSAVKAVDQRDILRVVVASAEEGRAVSINRLVQETGVHRANRVRPAIIAALKSGRVEAITVQIAYERGLGVPPGMPLDAVVYTTKGDE